MGRLVAPETNYSAGSTVRYIPRFCNRSGIDVQMYSMTWSA